MFLKYLSTFTLSILFTLIFVGGYVSASGVGLSCPEWPMCPAGLVPQDEFIIEYFHRTIAALTALMVIVTMAFTLKTKKTPKGMKIASIIASCAVIGQITLGGFVIIERLHAILVTIHLGLGITLFSMVLLTTLYAWKLSKVKMKIVNNVTNKSISDK